MISRLEFLAAMPGAALLRRLRGVEVAGPRPDLINPACEITGNRVHMIWREAGLEVYGRSYLDANDMDTKQRVKNNLLRELLNEYERHAQEVLHGTSTGPAQRGLL